jgi:hypothetical protein
LKRRQSGWDRNRHKHLEGWREAGWSTTSEVGRGSEGRFSLGLHRRGNHG